MKEVEWNTHYILKLTCDKLKYVSDNVLVKKKYTLEHWRRSFKDITVNGRFMQCDKNLGVRFVTFDYYNRLAEKELLNYETIITDRTPRQILLFQQRCLAIIAGCIRSEAEKPILHYNRHSQMFFTNNVTTHCVDLVGLKTDRVDRVSGIVHDINTPPDRLSAQNSFDMGANRTVEGNVFLGQLADHIVSTSFGDIDQFKLPQLRMTLKIHKPEKNGLIPTRPIIPTCCLPNFVIGQWLGSFMARMARTIPWNLENSDDFQTWITDRRRGPRVASFDFSNLYGTEPVKETLCLFDHALKEMSWKFTDPNDTIIFESLSTTVKVPHETGLIALVGEYTSVFILVLAELIRNTIAELDVNGSNVTVCTSNFLAMGCPPVAPLSIITLAYLEAKVIGFDRCTLGMKRYIDDVIIDKDLITEELLRSTYPGYLTLNYADNNHYLDVAFDWNGMHFVTWPYVKEFAVIPLNYFSNHPAHTIRAAAKNELIRLMKRTTLHSAKPDWVEFWYTKYSLACYPENELRCILKEVIAGTRMVRSKQERGINHVEQWHGTHTHNDAEFSTSTGITTATAWKAGSSLLSIALKAHILIEDKVQNLLNNEKGTDKGHIDFFSKNQFPNKDKNTPEDGSTVQGSNRKASGQKTFWKS